MLPSSVSNALRRLSPIVGFFLIGLVLLGVSRLGLSLWQGDQVSAADGWTRVLLQGLRVDVASLCLLYGLPACLVMLLPDRVFASPATRRLLGLWLTLVTVTLAFLELATPDFMHEYGLRPNRLFVEYLIYPREVAATLLKGHAVSVVVGVVVTALVAWGSWRLAARWLSRQSAGRTDWRWRLPLAAAVLLLAALGARSTLGHRPLNPALVAFSSNPTVNELPLNSFYSVGHAIKNWLKQEDGAEIYGTMPLAEIVATVRKEAGMPATRLSTEIPTLAYEDAVYQGEPRNLVIVLEESLGAQFIGSLGGRPLSPNFDRLAEQGWAFDRLYATGTRSVRGIEAVLTGFPPTPAQSVVKLAKSQDHFFTIAELLRRRGYDTTFYYGGESHFDNMRGFFLGNGFQRIIDQDDYVEPAFVGSWGVSDEDLLIRADKEFRQLHARGQPFFGLVFSSSNHDPFEFPDGRIELFEQPKQTRNNAAKYADYALGEFFKRAKASDYWDDTIFLVVADHDSRVFGADLVPIERFHIPGLILGADVEPRRDDRIVSQIDLAPTLLSLIGIEAPTPLIGHDLTDPGTMRPGRAMMQYGRNYAWMQGDAVVILQPGKAPMGYRYRPGIDQLQPGPIPRGMAHTALAVVLWGSQAYDRRLYHLPDDQHVAGHLGTPAPTTQLTQH